MLIYAASLLYLIASCLRLSLAQDTNSTLIISEDGNCGGTTGQTCLGSSFGNCCSGKGYCGSTTDYCNAECQSTFGQCVANASSISSDGRCGTTDPSNQICLGSSYGNCCSETGWCGSTDDYCGTGCQGDFGECDKMNTVVVPVSSQATSMSTASITSTSSLLPSSASSTFPSPTATATAAPASERPTASRMSTGAKAGVGVGVAAAGVGIIGAVILLLRRRRARKQTSEFDEKVEAEASHPTHLTSAATSSQSDFDKDAYVNNGCLPPTPVPAELSNQRHSRAELEDGEHGPMVESISKEGQSEVNELPAGRL